METSWSFGPTRKRGFVSRHVKAFAIGTAIATMTATGIGFAIWLTGGTGRGFGKSSHLNSLVLLDIPSAEMTGDLFPGGDGDLSIRVSNTNNFPVFVRSVIFDSGNGVETQPTACNPSLLTAPGLPATNLSLGPIPANGQGTVVLNDVLHLDIGAPDNCQDTRFSVPLMITGSA
jgi:hypothetical protein